VWKGLWTSRQKDYEMSEWMYECENERNVRGQVFKEIIDEFVINVQKYVISNQS